MMVGGWKIADIEACELPQKIAAGFKEAFNGIVGAKYIPVLYCGYQIVKGTNHAVICKLTQEGNNEMEHIVKVILSEDLDGKFQIIKIEIIL